MSENQCFFYAGNISEELIDREKYKIALTFNEDGTIGAKAVDSENQIDFEVIGQPTYTTRVMEDATYPLHRTPLHHHQYGIPLQRREYV